MTIVMSVDLRFIRGKVTTTDTFRLCALGAIDVEDIEEFFKVLREALIENNIRVPVQYR